MIVNLTALEFVTTLQFKVMFSNEMVAFCLQRSGLIQALPGAGV